MAGLGLAGFDAYQGFVNHFDEPLHLFCDDRCDEVSFRREVSVQGADSDSCGRGDVDHADVGTVSGDLGSSILKDPLPIARCISPDQAICCHPDGLPCFV